VNAVTIGFASTAATLFVTVVLFGVERIASMLSARNQARRDLVARVINVFETAARTSIRPALARAWTNPEVEYALLLPRLLLELRKRDRVIALWVQRQVQLMQLEPRKRERIKIQAKVAEKLVLWHHGEASTSWFALEIRKDPPVPGFSVPLRVRTLQLAGMSWSWAQLFFAIGGLAAMIRQAVRTF